MIGRSLSLGLYAAASVLGLLAFCSPFLQAGLAVGAAGASRPIEAPIVLSALVGLGVLALIVDAQVAIAGTKSLALLAMLASVNAVLRLVDNALPLPGGFSPIFFLIIASGYVLGGRFGFMLGVATMLVSAVITGGVGPWLPYQMFAAGWIGLAASAMRPLVRAIGGTGKRREIVVLAVLGAFAGFAYGAVMNLWFWPYIRGADAESWTPGEPFWRIIEHYLRFYLATSLVWDTSAAIGNVVLMAVLGQPVLVVLRRFHRRMDVVIRMAPAHGAA